MSDRAVLVTGLLLTALLILTAAPAQAAGIDVRLDKPTAPLTMGDTPVFQGTVHNGGSSVKDGLVVFLTIVNLESGNEHPLGLEDWSANPAVRIDHLAAGQTNTTQWTMRLVQGGNYAAALTVIDPTSGHPISSDLVPFTVATKPTLQSSRILPIAIGEPLVLLGLVAVVLLWRAKGK